MNIATRPATIATSASLIVFVSFCCSLSVVLLFVVRRVLFVVCCMLSVVCCLFVFYYLLLLIVCCSLLKRNNVYCAMCEFSEIARASIILATSESSRKRS